MKTVSDSELKTIELEILREVAAFCDAHGVRYYLACGTALGAVRHDGFIPWDDDIDLALPRPDYERFLSLFRSEKHTVLDSRFDDRYPYAFAKVSDNATCLVENIEQPFPMGVYIDLFPIDGLPANEAERKRHLKRIAWDLRILSWKRISGEKKVGFAHKLVQIAAKKALKRVPVKTLVRRLDSDARRYAYEDSPYAAHLVTSSIWGSDVKPKRVFDNPVRHRFEDGEYWLPGNIDEYLRIEYGDYMQLPPEKDRIARHGFTVFWKDGGSEEKKL